MLSQLSYSPSEAAQAIQRESDCQRRGASSAELPSLCAIRRAGDPRGRVILRDLRRSGGIGIRRALKRPRPFGPCGFESHLRHRTRGVAPPRRIPERRAPSEFTDNRDGSSITGRLEEIALHKLIRALALAFFISLGTAVLAPGAALAQYREFTGRIDKINDKKMIVDNRQGDKVTFDKVPDTKIDDTHEAKKKVWSDLKSDDWVTVKWKMVDKPRKAYEVIVLPPKSEAGEEE